jgi:hypothetical protein
VCVCVCVCVLIYVWQKFDVCLSFCYDMCMNMIIHGFDLYQARKRRVYVHRYFLCELFPLVCVNDGFTHMSCKCQHVCDHGLFVILASWMEVLYYLFHVHVSMYDVCMHTYAQQQT